MTSSNAVSKPMKLETLLPLGKLDPGLREPDTPLHIGEFASGTQQAEAIGYDAVLVEDTKDDPYQLLALGAAATSTVGVGTSVAMAFPRSPTVTAASAWSLQKLSAGRFELGLGTQVRGHIRRRFGMEWHAPAPWMRDYVGALRAVWNTWQTGQELAYKSERYNLNLMVPLFNPGPIDHPEIPIHLAAIGPNMCALAGELADGVRLHPICTERYIDERVKPAVATGAARTERDIAEVDVCMKALIGTAATDEQLEQVTKTVRARVAFYLSTPAYRRVFELHDWGDLAQQAAALSKDQKWEELAEMLPDEILHTVATIGTHETIVERLRQRYVGRVDRLEFSIPVKSDEDADTLRNLLIDMKA